MYRLKTLESHVTAMPTTTGLPPRPNLLEKYKKMSSLQSELLKVHLNSQLDLKFQEKVENIFRDKRFFEPMSYEEEDRVTQREKINTKLLRFLKEINKIMPLNEVFNDLNLYCAMCLPTIIYNDNITTKISVNF